MGLVYVLCVSKQVWQRWGAEGVGGCKGGQCGLGRLGHGMSAADVGKVWSITKSSHFCLFATKGVLGQSE